MSYTEQSVRDGNRVLRFLGWKLAAVSAARPGVQRWSELELYVSTAGEYLVQKIGRTTICHRPECRFVTHRMPSWLEAREEGKVHRTPCLECAPLVGNRMDPHTQLEVQRYTVFRAASMEEVTAILVDGRENVPTLVRALLAKVSGTSSR